jgi:hypothetical protein
MAFMNFLKAALPVAAGIFGSPALGAAVGAGLEFFGSNREAGAREAAAREAGQTAMQGFNYLTGSPVGTQYLPAGGNAIAAQAALLGIGGDPMAARAAFENYQNSTGYQAALQSGTDAITSSAAASGALGSGSTLRALQRYGTELGQQGFNNYLANLAGVSGMGLQAGSMIGSAAQAGAGAAAQYQYAGANDAASARREGFNALASGLGGVFGALQAGSADPVKMLPAPKPVKMLPATNALRGYA